MINIRVLGCYGGEMPGCRTTCLLVNDNFMIDAGAATAGLTLKEQEKIDAIVVSHSHLDHVRDLGFLADNIFGKREKPVRVFGLPETIAAIRAHVLNNSVWPDFSKLPSEDAPVLSFHELHEGIAMEIEGFVVTAIKVNHPVPTAGLIIKNETSAFTFSGDTGPTRELWKAASKEDELRAVFLETSFPDRMAEVAELSGHLTPRTAREEVKKISRPDVPVYLFHMKPQYLKEIEGEVDGNFHLTRQGDSIEI